MRARFVLLLVLAISCPAQAEEPASAQTWADELSAIGTKAVRENQSRTSKQQAILARLKAKAEKGDADAAYQVGLVYESNRMFDDAITWFGRAAALGHKEASVSIDRVRYEQSLQVQRDSWNQQRAQDRRDAKEREWQRQKEREDWEWEREQERVFGKTRRYNERR